jgi:hypothetical protein
MREIFSRVYYKERTRSIVQEEHTLTMENQVKIYRSSTPYIQTCYRPAKRKRKEPRLLTILLCCLTIVAFVHFIIAIHPLYPTDTANSCQRLIRESDYTKYISLQTNKQEMQAVQYIDQATGGLPAALVLVNDTSEQRLLDVYVFSCTMQQVNGPFAPAIPALSVVFKRQGLIEGTATITAANTLSTSQLDSTLSQTTRMLMQPEQQDVYREYTWQRGAFVQTLFPGYYPVTSRGEAEDLQDQVNNGHALPWSDPLFTSEQMAKDILHWPEHDIQETLRDNDGATAHVLLTQQHPHFTVVVTLNRLVQHNSSGLWFVTGARTPGMTLKSVQQNRFISSPLHVEGTAAIDTDGATTILYSHTLTPLNILNAPTIAIQRNGTYSGTILYTNDMPGQQGLLLIRMLPAGKSASGQLLLTNLILN